MSHLDELAAVLGQLAALVEAGEEVYRQDLRQRWSIERLWIHAGNLAAAHCEIEGIDHGLDPWSELIGLRNVYAHYLPSDIVPERVWADSVGDLVRLRQAVEAARPATP